MRFVRVDLFGLDLSQQNLTGSTFTMRCNLTNVRLDDAVITKAWFDNSCVGLTAEQIQSTWNYKHRRMEGIVLPAEITRALSGN